MGGLDRLAGLPVVMGTASDLYVVDVEVTARPSTTTGDLVGVERTPTVDLRYDVG